MKKLVTLMLVVLATCIYSMDWYGGKEKVTDLKMKHEESKDTLWYNYSPDMAYAWKINAERATYVNVNDFGLEYPINLHALSAYLYDDGFTHSYKVYDKDGSTVLYQSPEFESIADYNDYFFDTPLIMKDDFWISVTPDAGGTGEARHITSSELTSCNSYIGDGDGVWEPLYDGSDYFELVTYVALSPYQDEDLFAPIFRTVTGTEVFMDSDTNLSIMVQDQSPIAVSTGQFSTDGGANWTDFTVTADAKGSYNFTGVIPGQADGTVASAKVYFEDDLGYGAWSEEFEVIWSKDTPLLMEDFEGDFPPAGWALVTGNHGWEKGLATGGAYVYEGDASMMHFAYDTGGLDDDWIWTPELTIPATGAVYFSLYHMTNWITYYDLHEIGISTDGGTTYTQIYEGYGEVSDIDPDLGVFSQLGFLLSDYAGQAITIGFHYRGDWSSEWYIDNVSVLFDGNAPVISDIKTNDTLYPLLQEYYNNDMNVQVSFDDLIGVSEATGHYSFDGGTTWTDVVMTKNKGTEVWSCIIPARTDDTAGTVYFDYVDLGGNADQSEEYSINFIPDENPPVVVEFDYGFPVFLNEDMNITLTFTDESAISTCSGFYTEDGGTTETAVEMTPSKDHMYTYVGTIPAKAALTFGEIRFALSDAVNNTVWTPYYEVMWLEGSTLIFDDFDANHDDANWVYGNWAMTDEASNSPTHSVTDSPGANYEDNQTNILKTKIFDFSAAKAASMTFWAKIDLEANYDYVYLEGSGDGGASWKTLQTFNGDALPWQKFSAGLGAFAGADSAQFRFRLKSDGGVTQDGMWIDDVEMYAFNNDIEAPLIVYDGPETQVLSIFDYTVSCEIIDYSGLSEAKLLYSVNMGAWSEVTPDASSSGDTYNFIIPAQTAGSIIEFKIMASDASTDRINSSETEVFTGVSGYHLNYQNGIGDEYVDYLDIIGTAGDAGAYAVAKRLTMGPWDGTKSHYSAPLIGFTMANYVAPTYPSDPLYAHVWANENGAPGADLIEPIYMVQASTIDDPYAYTYVNLMGYQDVLGAIEGDVFVGMTSSGEHTNILYEVVANHTGVEGYVDFNRTWLGQQDGEGGINWSFDDADIYHITGVTGSWTEVDGPLMPGGFTADNAVPADGTAVLSWKANADSENVVQYNIYRDIVPGFMIGTPIATIVSTDPLTYIDSDVTVGTTYYYKMTATDDLGFESAVSVELPVTIAGINENIPLVTELFQNYPNPFNPDTAIKFNLANNAKVSLTVYNSKGELVSKLVDGTMKAGYYKTNFRSSNLVSGIYYYTLKVDNKVMTKKMMLIK